MWLHRISPLATFMFYDLKQRITSFLKFQCLMTCYTISFMLLLSPDVMCLPAVSIEFRLILWIVIHCLCGRCWLRTVIEVFFTDARIANFWKYISWSSRRHTLQRTHCKAFIHFHLTQTRISHVKPEINHVRVRIYCRPVTSCSLPFSCVRDHSISQTVLGFFSNFSDIQVVTISKHSLKLDPLISDNATIPITNSSSTTSTAKPVTTTAFTKITVASN